MVRFSRAFTVPVDEMRSLVRAEAVGHTIFKSVLSSRRFIFLIAEKAETIVDRTLDESHLRDREDASATALDNEPLIKYSSPCVKKQYIISSDS